MENPWRPETKREREVKNNAIKPNRKPNSQIPMQKELQIDTLVNYKRYHRRLTNMILGENNL